MIIKHGKSTPFLVSKSKAEPDQLLYSEDAKRLLQACTKGSLRVLCIVGPARRGKSLVINALATYIIARMQERGMPTPPLDLMVTSDDPMVPCTIGAQCMLLPHWDGGHILLIDCEGQDLGDCRLHEKLYTTALLSASELVMIAEGVLDNRVMASLGTLATTGALFEEGQWPTLAVLINKLSNHHAGPSADDQFAALMVPRGDANDYARDVLHRRFPPSHRYAAVIATDMQSDRESHVLESLKASPNVDLAADRQIAKDFRAFCKRALEKLPVKQISGKDVTPADFSAFIETAVEQVNSHNGMTNLKGVVELLQSRLCQAAAEKCFTEEFFSKLPQVASLKGDEPIDPDNGLRSAALNRYATETATMMESVSATEKAKLADSCTQLKELLEARKRELNAASALREATRGLEAARAAAEDAKTQSAEARKEAAAAVKNAEEAQRQASLANEQAKKAREDLVKAQRNNRGGGGGGWLGKVVRSIFGF